MKKIIVPILSLVFLSILSFIIFTSANANLLTEYDALNLGEEKYLQFLWMVDGAFNSERLEGDYIVNGKSLKDEDKIFTCKYKNKKDKECIGNNFEDEFKKLFSKRITFDDVYSDGVIYTWYSYEKGKYVFSNLDSCQINRMALNQEIKVIKIDSDKIIYQVSYENNKSKIVNNKDFVLILEDNEWKIDKAYYHDLCDMEYNIE